MAPALEVRHEFDGFECADEGIPRGGRPVLEPDGDQNDVNWGGRFRRSVPALAVRRAAGGDPRDPRHGGLAALAGSFSHQQTIPFFIAVIVTSIVGGGVPSIAAVILSAIALENWVPDVQPHSLAASVVAGPLAGRGEFPHGDPERPAHVGPGPGDEGQIRAGGAR